MRQRSEHKGSQYWTTHRLAPAEEHHGDDCERLLDREIVRLDIAQVKGIERPRDRGTGVSHQEGDQLVPEDIDAERATNADSEKQRAAADSDVERAASASADSSTRSATASSALSVPARRPDS